MRERANIPELASPATSVQLMKRRKSEPKADIASRKASKSRDFASAYLEGTESSLGELDADGSQRFGEAWEDGEDASESLDAAINVESNSIKTRKHRSLEQQRTRMFVGVGLAVVVVAGLAFLATRSFTDDDAALAPNFNDGSTALLSPLASRSYEDLGGPVEVVTVASVDQFFIDEASSGELQPLDVTDAGELGVGDGLIWSGPVMWAGRAHLAVISDQELLAEQRCVIATLVSADLRAIDVATAGDCDEESAQLGDRTACRGTHAVLLEMWPFNPDSVVEPEPVAAIRTRVESVVDGSTVSRRSTLVLAGLDGAEAGGVTSVIDAASVLRGAPGDVATVLVDGVEATCTLLDRAAVEVRLLPG